MRQETLLAQTTLEHWGAPSAGRLQLVAGHVAVRLDGLSYLMESGLHEELDVNMPQSNLEHYVGLCISHVIYT